LADRTGVRQTAAADLYAAAAASVGNNLSVLGCLRHAALDREIERLVLASSGTRNATLNCASFVLHQLVAGGELHAEEVMQALHYAAERNGLLAEDRLRRVQATIESGATDGLRSPRDRLGRR
jgi:hypothetical protein